MEGDQLQEAEELALQQISDRLSDHGLLMATQDVPQAIERLRNAIEICPSNHRAFHNLLVELQRNSLLRFDNLKTVEEFIKSNKGQFPWLSQYIGVLFSPLFINLGFTAGKCNLKCRMCNGTNSEGFPNELSYISAEDFEKTLQAIPTANGLTLSSGDSDPLLHPQIEEILELVRQYKVRVDFFTNGHALSTRLARTIVDSHLVNMINFSIDAATPETYQRIRGADLNKVIQKIETLQDMKRRSHAEHPLLSFSFVAMADNIHELPAFVEMGLRLGAYRVYVEFLGGGEFCEDNRPPTENPRYFEYVQRAQELVLNTPLILSIPAQLQRPPASAEEEELPSPPQEKQGQQPGSNLSCCSWVRGVFVSMDGDLTSCCLLGLSKTADLGNIHDGLILENSKYIAVRALLAQGKVFPACLQASGCEYVAQQKAQGRTPPLITKKELQGLVQFQKVPLAAVNQ